MKIQSKMKELEWSQHYSLILLMLKGANSEVSNRILPKFKLIQALIVVLIVCKNEEDPFKMESTRVATTFLPFKSMGILPNAQGQVTHKFCSSNIQISYSRIDIVTYVTSCYRLTPRLTECKHLLFDAP